jgi:hypothetical protein
VSNNTALGKKETLAGKILNVDILGENNPVKFRQITKGLEIKMPTEKLDEDICIFRITELKLH